MSLTMYDSVTVGDVPLSGEQAVAGYVGGTFKNFGQLVAKFPHLPALSIAVDASEDAQCLDVERGDATVDQIPVWLDRQARLKPHDVHVIYTSASQVAAAKHYIGARKNVMVWSAHYTDVPHICGPGHCQYPAVDATQWFDKGAHGEHIDVSLISADFYAAIAHRPITTKEPAVVSTVNPSAAKVIALAKSQVGVREGRDANGNWNNDQKYSKQVPGMAWSNFQPWCATFVSWLAWKSGMSSLFPRTASVAAAMQWYKQRGQFHAHPAIGSQVIYGNGAHTGFVIGYTVTTIRVIEGNTNNNGSSQGNGVYELVRQRSDPWITGYGYPKYPEGIISAKPGWPNPVPVPKAVTAKPSTKPVKQVWPTHVTAFKQEMLAPFNGAEYKAIGVKRPRVKVAARAIQIAIEKTIPNN